MCNILIFGKTGMLGAYFDKYLSKNHNVTAIDRAIVDAININYDVVSKLIDGSDVVINCYGLIKQRLVSDEDMLRVNTIFPQILSSMCHVKNKKFIHLTTDCVYDGSCGMYNEESPATYKDVYGLSKYLGEKCKATIIRTSIIGEERYNKKSLLEWVLRQKGEVRGYKNHYWNGVTCLELSKVVNDIVSKGKFWDGVRIVNSNKVTKYDMVKYIKDVYSLDFSLIEYESEFCDRSMESLFEYPNNLVNKTVFEQIKDLKGWLDNG